MEWVRKNSTTENTIVEQEHRISPELTVPLLHVPLLESTGIVIEGFSTRAGGVSKGIFSTMNLSFTRGDEREAVEENYRRIAKALGVDYDRFVFSDQTHTTNVLQVTEKDAGNGITREREYPDIDGLITNVPGLMPGNWAVPFRLAWNGNPDGSGDDRTHAGSVRDRSGRPYLCDRSIHLSGLL